MTTTFAALKKYMHETLSTTSKHEPVPSVAAPVISASPSLESEDGFEETVRMISTKLWTLAASYSSTLAAAAPPAVKQSLVSALDPDQEFLRVNQLDGAYILPRVLVVGPPRRALNATDSYRNDANKLRAALKERHALRNEHLLVFDFAPGQSRVDLEAINYNCVRFDLNRATLQVLLEASAAVVAWLEASPENVALLTCSNGIKVSSLVAACVFAAMSGNEAQARDGALRFFERRLKWKSDDYDELLDKLPPSYGRLWSAVDGEGAMYARSVLFLRRLVVRQLPPTSEEEEGEGSEKAAAQMLRVVVRTGPGFSTAIKSFEMENGEEWNAAQGDGIRLSRDVALDFSLGNVMLFSFSFPTRTLRSLMPPSSNKGEEAVLLFGPDVMDEYKKHALPGDFELELTLQDAGQEGEEQEEQQKRGLDLLSARHCVQAHPTLVQLLVQETGKPALECAFALQRSNNDLTAAKQELRPAPKSVIKSKRGGGAVLTPHNGNSARKPSAARSTPKFANFSPTEVENIVVTPVPFNNNTGNSKQQPQASAGKALTPVTYGGSSNVTPKKRSASKKQQQQQVVVEEGDDAELNSFLKEVIGTSLGSPMRTPKQNQQQQQHEAGKEDSALVAQFARLYMKDATFKQKVELLVKEKNAAVVVANATAAAAGATASPSSAPSTTSAAAAAVAPPKPSTPPAAAAAAVPEPPAQANAGQTLGNHEVYGTFFKMLKCGVPRDCVEQKMRRDGHNVRALELGPNALVSDLREALLGEHDVYGKFFKMLKCGIPAPAVKQRMQRDGLVPAVLDLGEEATMAQLDQVLKAAAASASTSGVSMKKKVIRKTNIRWDAIPAERLKKGSTIWHDEAEVDRFRDLFISNDEFEHLFVQAPPSTAPSTTSSTTESAAAPKALLDSRRAQSVSIGMAKLKLTGEQLATALLAMDETVLTCKEVQVIQGCSLFPTEEELALLLKQTTGKLAAPDAFLRCVGERVGPEQAKRRVEALSFRFHFDELVAAARGELVSVQTACTAIRTSGNLKDLLRIVLLVGNHINGNCEESKIAAFTLASLSKLSQTKSVNKTVNVLEYMVGFIMKKSPQVLAVVQDLESVNPAKRIDLSLAGKQVQDVCKTLDVMEERFPALFTATTMRERAQELDSLCNQVKLDFAQVLEYLGEDPGMSSSDFLTTLASFLSSLTQTRAELEERERRLARKQQQTAAGTAGTPTKKTKRASPLKLRSNVLPAAAAAAAPVQKQQDEGAQPPYPHLAQFLKSL